MKRTITSILLLLSTVFTAMNVSAQEANDPIQSADRDKISATVMEALGRWDSQSYQNCAALVVQMTDYDMTALQVEALMRILGMKTAIEGTPDYRLLFSGQTFTGHYNVVDGKWAKESEANDLQFSFNDRNGVPVVIKVETSGDTKRTNLPVDADDLMDSFDITSLASRLGSESEPSETTQTVSALLESYFTGVTLVSLDVPAKTDISMTYNGTPMMHGVFTVDLTSLGETPLDGLMMDSDLTFYKGVIKGDQQGFFELTLANSGYKPGTGININFTAKNEAMQLLSLKINAPGTLTLPSFGFDDDDDEAAEASEGTSVFFGLESLNIDIDVMGKAQVKGGIASFNDFAMAMAALDEDSDEATFKSALDVVNQQLNINLYYDGGSTPAAKVALLPTYDEEWEEWDTEVGFIFASDNNAYSFEEFFTVENFPEVAQTVATISSEVDGLVENLREKVDKAVSAIKSVKTADSQPDAVAIAYYTLAGTRTTADAKGLKIVKMSDGSTKKVLVK